MLDVPCVTARDSTELPETVDMGSNVLAGTDPEIICNNALMMMAAEAVCEQPFGDGYAGRMTVQIVKAQNIIGRVSGSQ